MRVWILCLPFLSDVDAKTFVYRLDELPDAGGARQRLAFRGATLLDLFPLDESSVYKTEGDSPRPDFRLPLTAQFDFNRQVRAHGLVLFANGRTQLDLGVPLPVPRIEGTATGGIAKVLPLTTGFATRARFTLLRQHLRALLGFKRGTSIRTYLVSSRPPSTSVALSRASVISTSLPAPIPEA